MVGTLMHTGKTGIILSVEFQFPSCTMSKKTITSNEAILQRVEQARIFIENNFQNELLLEDIAAAAHLSKAHLARKFKEAYQVTPNQFLVEVRLRHAAKLLKTTNLPVKEIVNQVGFYSTSSFIRLFKNEFGTTPMVFRKEKKKGTV
jgi:AraC family transcriptional regulator